MAYVNSVDWITGEITILQASMTIVQASPEIRELDIDLLRLELRDLEDDVDGRPWPRTHNHSTTETLVGTTYQRKVTFLDPYYFTFTGASYSINLVNGDSNLSAFTPAYNARVNTANSAGSTVTEGGGGASAGDIWNALRASYQLSGSFGEALMHTLNIDVFVFIDTELGTNGDGTVHSPFNNIQDAVDYAELHHIQKMKVYSDVTLLNTYVWKNFTIEGVGTPVIDCGGADLDGSKFSHCWMRGNYAGIITVQESVLDDGFWLNGQFERCGLNGDLFCVDGAQKILVASCYSMFPGLERPTISMNATGWCTIGVRDIKGGMTIKHCNNPLDKVSVGVAQGSLTFDSSNTDGVMVARGGCKFVDETNGAAVTDETYSRWNIAALVWDSLIVSYLEAGSFGWYVQQKLLTTIQYLGKRD